MLSQIEEREGSVRPSIEFEVGDTVKVSDGPFESQNGIVEEIDPERGKCALLLPFLVVPPRSNSNTGRLRRPKVLKSSDRSGFILTFFDKCSHTPLRHRRQHSLTILKSWLRK